MELGELKVYNLSMEISQDIWQIINHWEQYNKEAIGKQLIRAADAVSANLSRGFGRYHYKDAKNFGYYARGSLFETKCWLNKSIDRNLIGQEDYDLVMEKLGRMEKMLNNYIKSIGRGFSSKGGEEYGSKSNEDLGNKVDEEFTISDDSNI